MGPKEKARRKKCKVRFSIIKKNEACVKKLLRAGMMPARTAHAVGMSPPEKLKLRRQMAAAAGKKSTTAVLVHGGSLEVEEELPTMATQYWARRSLDRKMESRAERSLDEADSRFKRGNR